MEQGIVELPDSGNGIKFWSKEDRPREKLACKGSASVTDAELLAILIASGTPDESALEVAKRILRTAGNSLSELSRMPLDELLRFRGIGQAKALSIIAALELGRRRLSDQHKRAKSKIFGSFDAFMLVKPLLDELSHEEFWILYVNGKNEVFRREQVSRGGLTSTVVDPKVLFKKAIQQGASGLILVHNHPSGSSAPSQEDTRLTMRLWQAGRLLDIDIIDHIIIGNTSYYSFADEGRLTPHFSNASSGNYNRGKASDH
ncbi:MAG: RadC family protein [Bacteroidia bacterium]